MTEHAPLPECPLLRPIDVRPLEHQGRRLLYLRDPLQISPQTVLLPQQVAPLLPLLDGTRNVAALRASLAVRYGLALAEDVAIQVLTALDEAALLENGSYRRLAAEALATYRAAPHRPSLMAGASYPNEPAALKAMLDGFSPAPPPEGAQEPASGDGQPLGQNAPIRGVISPHIDYERGGPVYAAVWGRARPAARAADLVVVLGTDHYGSPGRITLTRQHYGTAYGVLPTDGGLVGELAAALGEEAVFEEELHHRSEHAVELSAVWCHHARNGAPCHALPVLCGSICELGGEERAAWEGAVARFVEIVRGAMARQRVLIVASADLAHVGPAFGGQPLGLAERAQLKAADEALLAHICAGDAEGFLAAVRATGNRNNVCGVAPIYLLLRLLGEGVRGETVAYTLCPADARGTSVVSVGGVVLA